MDATTFDLEHDISFELIMNFEFSLITISACKLLIKLSNDAIVPVKAKKKS